MTMRVLAVFLALQLLAASGRRTHVPEKLVHQVPPCVRAVDGANVTCIARCIGGREGARPPLNPFLVFDSYHCVSRDQFERGFPAHPHRGFAEIRYFHEGGLRHVDSCDGTGETHAGGAQVLLANRGIVHEEQPLPGVGGFRGFQVWVNVPEERKCAPPAFHSFNHIAEHAFPGSAAAAVKVLAGDWAGVRGPLTAVLPGLLFIDVTRLVRATAPMVVDAPIDQHALVFVHRGAVVVGAEPRDQQLLQEGELAVLSQGSVAYFQNGGRDADQPAGFLFLTAPKVHEPVFLSHGFVASSREGLDAAVADLHEGRSSHC